VSSRERDRVLVTGIGLLAAGAASAPELGRILEGDSPPGPVDITAFEVPSVDGAPELAFELTDFEITDYLESIKSYIDRTSALACAAAKLALDDAGLAAAGEEGRPEVGLAYGTCWGCLDSMELFFHKVKEGNPRLASPLPFSHSYANSPAAVLAIEFGLRGFHTVSSSGWNSATIAVSQAAEGVRRGASPAVLAGGSESGSHGRFMHLLGKGLIGGDGGGGAVFGEGGCFLVLESAESAAARGARPLAEIIGWGSGSAGQGTAGDKLCSECVRASIESACADGGVDAASVAAYCGCASGVGAVDAAEVHGFADFAGRPEGEARALVISPYLATGLVEGVSGAFAAALGVLVAAEERGPVAVGTLDPGGSAAALVIGPVEE